MSLFYDCSWNIKTFRLKHYKFILKTFCVFSWNIMTFVTKHYNSRCENYDFDLETFKLRFQYITTLFLMHSDFSLIVLKLYSWNNMTLFSRNIMTFLPEHYNFIPGSQNMTFFFKYCNFFLLTWWLFFSFGTSFSFLDFFLITLGLYT